MLRRVPAARYGIGLRVGVASFVLVCLFVIGLGVYSIWNSVVSLPATYAALQESGVPANAKIDRCASGIGGGRGVGCELSLTYAGSRLVWDYPENSAQFARLPGGSLVSVLVDPAHPDTVYTVTDVRARTNTGFGPMAIFGIACVLAGLLGVWLLRRTLSAFPRPVPALR